MRWVGRGTWAVATMSCDCVPCACGDWWKTFGGWFRTSLSSFALCSIATSSMIFEKSSNSCMRLALSFTFALDGISPTFLFISAWLMLVLGEVTLLAEVVVTWFAVGAPLLLVFSTAAEPLLLLPPDLDEPSTPALVGGDGVVIMSSPSSSGLMGGVLMTPPIQSAADSFRSSSRSSDMLNERISLSLLGFWEVDILCDLLLSFPFSDNLLPVTEDVVVGDRLQWRFWPPDSKLSGSFLIHTFAVSTPLLKQFLDVLLELVTPVVPFDSERFSDILLCWPCFDDRPFDDCLWREAAEAEAPPSGHSPKWEPLPPPPLRPEPPPPVVGVVDSPPPAECCCLIPVVVLLPLLLDTCCFVTSIVCPVSAAIRPSGEAGGCCLTLTVSYQCTCVEEVGEREERACDSLASACMHSSVVPIKGSVFTSTSMQYKEYQFIQLLPVAVASWSCTEALKLKSDNNISRCLYQHNEMCWWYNSGRAI